MPFLSSKNYGCLHTMLYYHNLEGKKSLKLHLSLQNFRFIPDVRKKFTAKFKT